MSAGNDYTYAQANLLSISEFAGKFSHDLGNVLEAIRANLETLHELGHKKLDDTQLACLRDAMEACTVGTAVSHNLLGYARKQSYDHHDISLKEMVLDVVNVCSYTFSSRHEFILDEVLVQRNPMVYGSYSNLGYCFMTVLKDAVEMMPEEGKILLQVDMDQWYAHLYITGEDGMMYLEKTGEAGNANDATNVSLEVVRGIMEQNGGGLTTTYDGEMGSIILSFPLAQTQKAQRAVLPEPNQKNIKIESKRLLRKTQPIHFSDMADKLKSSKQIAKESVVLIDDDPLVKRGIGRLIESLGFKDVQIYSSPVNALEEMNFDQLPHWIFVDYAMPEMNGLQFIQTMREQLTANSKNIKTEPHMILMSAYPPDHVEKEIGNIGDAMVSFLAKPFNIETLKKLMLLKEHENSLRHTSIIRFGGGATERAGSNENSCYFGEFVKVKS